MTKDVLRKSFLVGLGMTAMAASKVEKEIKGMLKAHNITHEEADKAAQQFLKEAHVYQERVLKAVHKELVLAENHLKKHVRSATSKKKASAKRR